MATVDQLAIELADLARRAREAGDGGGLTRELRREVRDAVASLPEAVRRGLGPHLPDRYADDALGPDLRFTTRSSDSPAGMHVSVDVTTPGIRRRLKRLDDGVLEHPLFGNRRRWYKQMLPSVQPG